LKSLYSEERGTRKSQWVAWIWNTQKKKVLKKNLAGHEGILGKGRKGTLSTSRGLGKSGNCGTEETNK